MQRLQRSKNVLAPARDVLNLEKGALNLAAYCKSEGVSQIVHLAYPRLYTNLSAMSNGIVMLRNTLDTCRQMNIKLTFISSSVIFGDYKTTFLVADETTALRPKGPYGDAKFLEEMLVEAYFARGDIRRSICRLAPVYGPGGERPRLINTFREHILSGAQIHTHLYRNGRPALDLLYIDDAVEAVARTSGTDANEIFHFGSGGMHTTIEIAELIAKQLGREIRYDEIHIDEFIANIQMDSSKARDKLNWSPLVPLHQGIMSCLSYQASAQSASN